MSIFYKLKCQKKVIVLIIGLIVFLPLKKLYAWDENYSDYRRGDTILYKNVIKVKCPEMSSLFTIKHSSIDITLSLEDALRNYYSNIKQVMVTYNITLFNAQNDSVKKENDTLVVRYLSSGGYYDVDMNRYDNAVAARVTVTQVMIWNDNSNYSFASVQITSLPALTYHNALPTDLILEVNANVEKYITRDYTIPQIYKLTPSSPSSGDCFSESMLTNNELPLSWDYIPGADSYDLEWLFIDFSGAFNSADENILKYDFRNATRINTTNQNYNISLAYPKGIIIFRYRGRCQAFMNNSYSEYETTWSYPTTAGNLSDIPGLYKFKYCGLQDTLNWQYTATYAEDGKRKEVISFFDGTLRNRQQVTVVNSDKIAIIGETVYDSAGRDAVKILPAPTKTNGITFYTSSNNNMFNGSFNKGDFDGDAKISNPGALISGVGAELYYSSGNTFLSDADDFVSKYVPLSNGYAYTQTRYVNDGTNRVKSQSGLGPDFKLGSAHATNYFYGRPQQVELDRLFGNEAGFAIHYKKNVMIDPNGQTMITYLDQEGRTIATSLAGSCPESLIDLDKKPSPDVVIENLVSTLNNDNQMASTTVLSPYVATDYHLHYALGEAIYCHQPCPVCDTCKYRLNMILTDNEENTIIFKKENLLINPGTVFDTVVTLIPGTYTLVKSLGVDMVKMDSLDDSYKRKTPSCIEVPFDEPPPCSFTCETMCENSYPLYDSASGRFFTYYNNGVRTIGNDTNIRRQLINDCKTKNCGDQNKLYPDECSIYRKQLIGDLSPFGQYFDNQKIVNDRTGEFYTDRLSFNWWLNNNDDTLLFRKNGFGPIVKNIYMSYGKDSAWNYMRSNWQNEWGDTLLPFHPEYCVYYYHCIYTPFANYCNKFFNTDYRKYDSLLWNANDSAEAARLFLWNPLGLPTKNESQGQLGDNSTYLPYSVPPLDTCISIGTCYFPKADPLFWHCVDDTLPMVIYPGLGSNLYNPLGRMTRFLQNYIHFGTTKYSLWYLIEDPDNITGNPDSTAIDTSIIKLFRLLHNKMFKPIVDSGLGVSKFAYFTSVYSAFKKQILNELYDSIQTFPNKCDGGFYLNSHKTPIGFLSTDSFIVHFVRNNIFDLYNSDAGTMQQAMQDSIVSNCISTCESYGFYWMNQMAGCVHGNDSLQILNYFTEICIKSCGEANMRGNDSLYNDSIYYSPSNKYFHNFHDVVRQIATNTNCPVPIHPPVQLNIGNCSCRNFNTFIQHNIDTTNLEHLGDSIIHYFASQVGISYSLDTVTLWISSCRSHVIANDTATLASIHFPKRFMCANNIARPYSSYQVYLDSMNAQCYRIAYNNALRAYQHELDRLYTDSITVLNDKYSTYCYSTLQNIESFRLTYEINEYYYTLYYYDRAGNLVKTVPPKGVNVIKDTNTLKTVFEYRKLYGYNFSEHPGYILPDHSYASTYKFNSLEKPNMQKTPDAGISQTWYDLLGRPVFSQNAQQTTENKIAYTNYDSQGRIIETGQVNATPPADFSLITSILYQNIMTANINRYQVVHSIYDTVLYTLRRDFGNHFNAYNVSTYNQQNVRSRISTVAFYDIIAGNDYKAFTTALHYDYDIHGNVRALIQDMPMLTRFNRRYIVTKYNYDLVSGKVNMVGFQAGMPEQFFHKYSYDADNRITHVFTSRNGHFWDLDARYFYYKHGTLARIEIGEKQVQGVDYAYTLQGWMKLININSTGDLDGASSEINGNPHFNFASDALKYAINYFSSDYQNVAAIYSNDFFQNTTFAPLYNGNIAQTANKIGGANLSANFNAAIYTYKYDQLNRLKITDAKFGDNVNNPNFMTLIYDQNGNIDTLTRKGLVNSSVNDMDNMLYTYNSLTNQLDKVDDKVTASSFNGVDIQSGQTEHNYTYDNIGNLKSDRSESINAVDWTLYGKIKKISREALSEKENLEFLYDPMGNRISKLTYKVNDPDKKNYTIYARDAQGNIMAVYDIKQKEGEYYLSAQSYSIYGSSRLGVLNDSTHIRNYNQAPGLDITASYPTTLLVPDQLTTQQLYLGNRVMIANRFNSIFNNAYFIPYNSTFATVKAHFRRYLGRKEYELTDHLGNVMVALSDRKLAIPLSSPDVGVQNYLADIKSAQDYYPFGMQMPSRTFSSDKYRFGFNGKENDNEVKGTGSQQDYGMRIYDPRLVRFLSIDPITKKYPELTPYQFASNTPIWGIDLDGLEVRLYTETTQLGHTFLTVGKGKDLIVYTYGRYLGGNKGKSSSASSDPSGRGVLIRMTGTEAKRYLKHELKEYNAKAFEVKGANEQKTKEYYDKIFNSAPKLKESEVTEFEDKNIYGTPNQARVIDTYKLLGNNCTTKVIEAVNQSIKNADNKIPDVKGPMALQEALETESKVNPSQIKDVTKEVQKDVENISSGAGKSW